MAACPCSSSPKDLWQNECACCCSGGLSLSSLTKPPDAKPLMAVAVLHACDMRPRLDATMAQLCADQHSLASFQGLRFESAAAGQNAAHQACRLGGGQPQVQLCGGRTVLVTGSLDGSVRALGQGLHREGLLGSGAFPSHRSTQHCATSTVQRAARLLRCRRMLGSPQGRGPHGVARTRPCDMLCM